MKDKLPAALRAAMKNRTISEVSRSAGLTRQQLHRYLSGAALPRADAFLALCQTLGIQPSSLYETPVTKTETPASETLNEYALLASPPTEILKDGAYFHYRLPFVLKDCAIRSFIQVYSVGSKRYFEKRISAWTYRGPTPIKQERTYHGEIRYVPHHAMVFYTGNRPASGPKLIKPYIFMFSVRNIEAKEFLGVEISCTNVPSTPPSAQRTIIDYLGDVPIRPAYRQCGEIPYSELPLKISSYLSHKSPNEQVLISGAL